MQALLLIAPHIQHGVALSPGVNSLLGEFSYATSFPQPILMSAAFDDPLIQQVASIIEQRRGLQQFGRAGLDFWTPNITVGIQGSSLGRGQETPGEDPYRLSQYVYNLIIASSGLDPKPYFKSSPTATFAAYDLDNWRASRGRCGCAARRTDIDCGDFSSEYLPVALDQGLITETTSKRPPSANTPRLSARILRPRGVSAYRQLGWSDVNTLLAQQLAYTAPPRYHAAQERWHAPLSPRLKKLALVGPWANATTLMQGNYDGIAPFPSARFSVRRARARMDLPRRWRPAGGGRGGVAGGLDETVEREALDRLNLTWPGTSYNLSPSSSASGSRSSSPSSAGLTPSSGAIPRSEWRTALFAIITGKVAPAGRLPITQYPAIYATQVPMTDMTLRPSATNPGRTYKWYTGTPVFEFGFGLHYTTFGFEWAAAPASTYSIQTLMGDARKTAGFTDLAPLDTFAVRVSNTGKVTSDYVALLFVSGTFGPAPHPNKQLVSYTRVHGLAAGEHTTATLPVTLGSIARADEAGNMWVYPGSYKLALDATGLLTHEFTLTGTAAQITTWPSDTTSA
ncbi:putative exo-1,4-beta-xylosidase xlnD [Grifola frondosa]|uniref:Putative exo-1,4-beta-xylosidase xlnD n=1 Tax=Grifola frondosa TaxID=5627 RepID=A0A1C7MQ59_GRIFR|nr:putative exo-1,4-beta-xylosidase xlnD [Grifola frondosa]